MKGLGNNKGYLDLDPKILKQPLLDTNGPLVLNISQVAATAEKKTYSPKIPPSLLPLLLLLLAPISPLSLLPG